MSYGNNMKKIAHVNEARASRVRDIEALLSALQRERADIVRILINQMGGGDELYSHDGRLIASYRDEGEGRVFRLA